MYTVKCIMCKKEKQSDKRSVLCSCGNWMRVIPEKVKPKKVDKMADKGDE